jgi:hypothetical protein
VISWSQAFNCFSNSSTFTATRRVLLADASPALEAAQVSLRPEEPLRELAAAECLASVSVLRWAVQRGFNIREHSEDGLVGLTLCRTAAGGGALDVLVDLVALGGRCDTMCCAAAAEGGHLSVVKFLRCRCRRRRRRDGEEEGGGSHLQCCAAWDATAPAAAAAGGHVDVLRWMVAQGGCPTDHRTCTAAAWHGHADVLRVAREELRCDWDESAAAAAAARGHLATLDWATRAGCPWDPISRVALTPWCQIRYMDSMPAVGYMDSPPDSRALTTGCHKLKAF